MSQTYQPKKRKRAKTHGFLVRSASKNGKNVLIRRRRKTHGLGMFPKTGRLNRGLFEKIRKNGVTINNDFFSLFIGNTPDTNSHYSVVVSSKVAKTAVQRNKIRRLVYESFNKIEKIPIKSYILYAKLPILNKNQIKICEAIKSSINYYKYRQK